ncbi:MAG: phosphotransferase [Crocinitomicaceae bacterium]
MDSNFEKYLLNLTNASNCLKKEVIQSLWSGYGEISRYQLFDSDIETVVVKNINVQASADHPRGWNTDFGHLRKVRSYEVETFWYKNFAHYCDDSCPVPKFIGEFEELNEQWIVLEDLNKHYPLRKSQLSINEVKVCLKWLANFHAKFIDRKPLGLWKTGTYWHLETRPEEFEKIENTELKSKAQLIDEKLNNCQFQTIVHGDAKLANFCFSEDGNKVAAVDFQYVGGGCGMKDVAYFLGSCLSGVACEELEAELLDFYFIELDNGLKSREKSIDIPLLKEEWTNLYSYACADFSRFLLGWMPDHQKLNDYNKRKLEVVLKQVTLTSF